MLILYVSYHQQELESFSYYTKQALIHLIFYVISFYSCVKTCNSSPHSIL